MYVMSNIQLELESLLHNIQEGLKKYTIQELNEGIITFLNKKSDKSIEINYVLTMVCREYSISKDTLKSKKTRGLKVEAKQVAYCLLHLNLGFSLRYISRKIFFNNHNSVAIGIKRFKNADPKVKIDKIFIDKYKKLEAKLVNDLANINIENLENENLQ